MHHIMRKGRFGPRSALAAAALAGALALPSLANATVRSFVSTRCSVAPGAASRLDSSAAPVSFNYPYVSGPTAGYADAAGQAAGGLARAEGSLVANDDCTTDALFKDVLTVAAGTNSKPTSARRVSIHRSAIVLIVRCDTLTNGWPAKALMRR